MVTCLERVDLLALWYVMFSCIFVTFPCGVLGRVWCLIVSVPDLCLFLTLTLYRQKIITVTMSSLTLPICNIAMLSYQVNLALTIKIGTSISNFQKKDDPFVPKKYRLVSILSILSKIYEWLLGNQLTAHLISDIYQLFRFLMAVKQPC